MLLAAVIFDFDGVLADSEPVHLQAFQQVLQTIGIGLTPEAYYARYLGYSDRDAFLQVTTDRGRTLSEAELAHLLQVKVDVFPTLLGDHALFQGAAACVDRIAASVPVAIASGALRHEIELMLDTGGLRHRFPIIVAAGDTPRSKPHPDPYARAFERLRTEGGLGADVVPGHVVAIEDSEWGLQSARGAGLRTLAVTTSYPSDRLPSADCWVRSIDEITLATLDALVMAAETPA